jgi:mRNA-degrading endonuclease RelE of RelBE toxin-antitoxin system
MTHTFRHPKFFKELRKIRKQASEQASKRLASEQARNQAVRKPTSAECDPNHSKREAG